MLLYTIILFNFDTNPRLFNQTYKVKMAFYSYFDSPDSYTNKFDFPQKGGSPQLLDKLMQFIEERKDRIQQIDLAWYLFNNRVFYEFLKELAKDGIKINVVTIPLEGFDTENPRKIKFADSNEYSDKEFSKYDLARDIFREHYKSNNTNGFNLNFFPHLYVRSPHVKKFSRGKLPYSLHIKACYISMKNGFASILSSSNFAVRDLVKNESLLIIENEEAYQKPFENFFKDLKTNSIDIHDYSKELNTTCNRYPFSEAINADEAFFSAPFYFDSSFEMESKLIDLLKGAKKEIRICAQHLAAFNYTVSSKFHSNFPHDVRKTGVLGELIACANRGVEVNCLSQTFSAPSDLIGNFNQDEFRRPANTRSFQEFISELVKCKTVSYFVNESVHSKYMVIDDIVVFCTYNYTPTQFIYLDKVNISSFKEMPELSYSGIHCEVASHVVIADSKTVKEFASNFDDICTCNESKQVIFSAEKRYV